MQPKKKHRPDFRERIVPRLDIEPAIFEGGQAERPEKTNDLTSKPKGSPVIVARPKSGGER